MQKIWPKAITSRRTQTLIMKVFSTQTSVKSLKPSGVGVKVMRMRRLVRGMKSQFFFIAVHNDVEFGLEGNFLLI